MRRSLWILLCAACAVTVASCGKHHDGDGDDTDGGIAYTSVRVEPETQTLDVALDNTASQTYQVIGQAAGQTADITAQCVISVDAAFGSAAGAIVTVGGHGGVATVTAACGNLSGTAQLTVDLTGTLILGSDTPANAAALFSAATAGTDPSRAPTVEYPIDNAVAPRNIPPMELQWTASGDDLFHVALTTPHETIDVYTSDPQATLADADWNATVGTSIGDTLAITVEGLAVADPATKYTGVATHLITSTDTIDTSAIYWWASSQGSIMTQTFGDTGAPTQVEGNCSGCHSVSRAGSRIGYSRCVNNDCGGEYIGFLHFNSTTNMWDEPVDADAKALQGTYTTFAPVGNPFPDDTTAVAMVTLQPSSILSLYDPDTGAHIPSNLEAVSVLDPAGTASAHAALMPDWSADGNRVVFASTPHVGQTVDLSDSAIATMTYSYAGGTHTFGNPAPLLTPPLTAGGLTYDSLFFPSFSPDGKLVVFNAARDAWRNFTDEKTSGVRLMLADATTGAYVDLSNLNGGPTTDADITWPHWAPGQTSDYYWIVFSSERNYGHELTAGNTNSSCVANGVKQCKQIWISAISKAQLMSGMTIDPSAPPVWVPGQDIQADNISPYWSKPSVIQ